MNRNSKLLVNSTHKTKTWWIFVSVLVFVFVPFLIVILLCGEANLLDLNWIVAQNKSVWHGNVTTSNIEALVAKYSIFYNGDLRGALEQAMAEGRSISINSYKMFFNGLVLIPLFILLAWSFAYPIIFNATKVSGLDILPFNFSLGFMMFGITITGLIPVWTSLAWYWIVRLLMVSVVGFIVFFITNRCVNKFLANRPYSYDLVLGYKSLDNDTKKTREELKTQIDIFKHQKGQDKSYIDLPEGEK